MEIINDAEFSVEKIDFNKVVVVCCLDACTCTGNCELIR